MKLEHVIARTMAELRMERGWTQADLARRVSAQGLSWGPNRVTQLETLRRPVSLFEVAALTWVFEVPITRLIPGDEDIEAPDGRTVVPLAHLRAAMTGDATTQQRDRDASERQRRHEDEIRRVAKTLEIRPAVLEWLSRKLFGRAFIDERETRLGDVSDLSMQSARTKRGHVTRGLVAEIGAHLDDHGRENVHHEHSRHLRDTHDRISSAVLNRSDDEGAGPE